MNIASIFNTIKKHVSLEHCVIRFIMAWCFICFAEAVIIEITTNNKISSISYVGEIPLAVHLLVIAVFFVFIYFIFELINKMFVEKLSLLAVTFGYALFAVVQIPDVYFCVGLTALLIFSVAYAVRDVETSKISIKKSTLHLILIISGGSFILFTGGCTALRVLAYEAPNYDCGLFSQMFHYMKHTFTMNTTSERDRLLSHMCVHISPAYYLLLPFYAVFSSPVTLQVMQAVVIALGLIPLKGICKNHGLSTFETALAGIAYCFYPVMSGGCFYDIHENLFLPLFILCLIYFFEKDSWRGIIISMVLLLGVKEDAAIYGLVIGLYMLLEKCSAMWKKSVMLIVCCGIYFVFATTLLSYIGEGAMTYRFNNMVYGENGSMLGMIRTVLANPAYILTQMLTEEKIEFLLQTLASLCFLPLMSKRWTRYVLLVPFVLFNLMSDYTYFHSIYFLYVFGSGTLLVYLAIINAADLNINIRSRAIPMLAVSCIMFFGASVFQKSAIIERYTSQYNQETYAIFDEALSLIPDDASVTATTFLCPALSDHDVLYEWYYTDKTTEYIAFDLRSVEYRDKAEEFRSNPQYETVYYEKSRIAVFKNVKTS